MYINVKYMDYRFEKRKSQLTLMPSSSLTLLIILTHISVILLKVGCSRQMSRRILITLFLTLMPVSCRKHLPA